MTTKDLNKIIENTHHNLVDVEASVSTTTNNNGSNDNPNHPRNWSDQRRFDYARKWILEFARVTIWRDNDKACPRFSEHKDLVAKLNSFPEPFLLECVRYKTQTEDIDRWLKLTPEERYQRKKKNNIWHDTGVYMLYGNSYATSDKPGCAQDTGCIPECKYFEDSGRIEDDEVLEWYHKEIGNRIYEQLKHENSVFIQEFIEYLKKQADELPATFITNEYWYIPSIAHL